MMAAAAESESESTSIRLKSMHAARKAKGLPNGGSRPFGLTPLTYDENGQKVRYHDQTEADAVRAMAQWLLDGVSLRETCRRLDEQGIKPTYSGTWRPSSVKHVLQGDWLVGLQGGQEMPWAPILPVEQWQQIRKLFGDRVTGRAYPVHLLSGIARCGLCGHTLHSRPGRNGTRSYVCPKDLGGCAKIRIKSDDIEQDVVGRLFAGLNAGELTAEPTNAADPTSVAEVELETLKTRMDSLGDMVVAGTMSPTAFASAASAAERRMGELQQVLAAAPMRATERRMRAEALDLLKTWEELATPKRRQAIQALAVGITVGPAIVRGRHSYDPARVSVSYAG